MRHLIQDKLTDAQIAFINSGVADTTSILTAKTTANSGIISGGELEVNVDPTKIDISAGRGYIVDHTVYPPIVTVVEWDAFIGVILTNLTTSFATDLAINSLGAVVQQNSFTNEELRGLIFLGGVDHSNKVSILNHFEIQIPANGVGSSLRELSRAIGDINISGNVFSPNGANLKLNKSSGVAFKFGSNNYLNVNDPHTISQSLLVQAPFSYVYDNGSGIGVFSAQTTDVNPTNYDDGSGTLASVIGNNFTIQRLLTFPNANTVFIQYGSETFNNLSTAISGLSISSYTALAGIKTATIRGYLIVRANATALNNSSQAVFVEADRFGGIGARDGGGGTIDWGNIVGTLSNQIDLVNEFATKEDTLTAGSTLYGDGSNITNLPIKTLFKQNVDISHTGTTTETIIYSVLIPAGTMGVNDTLKFNIMFGTNTNNANVKTAKVYFNTINSLSGATQAATRTLASVINGNCLRNLTFRNSLASQTIAPVTTNIVSEESSSNIVMSDLIINFAVDQYFIVSAQLANGTDTMGIKYLLGQRLR